MTPEDIYAAYPRKVGRRVALLEIERAIRRVVNGEAGYVMSEDEAKERMLKRVNLYANSPAGKAGNYTPHARTWFHQSRYLDDPKEWQHCSNFGNAKTETPLRIGIW
jgi:hypothetical protein